MRDVPLGAIKFNLRRIKEIKIFIKQFGSCCFRTITLSDDRNDFLNIEDGSKLRTEPISIYFYVATAQAAIDNYY
jgi:hypothetical protein